MAAFLENRYAQLIVLDGHGAPAAVPRFWHIDIMHAVCLVLALYATPFWETKAPREWTEQELQAMLQNSPWAQQADPTPPATAYLATARPIREAEAEQHRRSATPPPEAANPDYAEFLHNDNGKHLVLAIPYPDPNSLADAAEARRMEKETILKIGRRKIQMDGHFPPTPSDPVLRLIFPRNIEAGDKTLVFELYLPGYSFPEKGVEFRLKDMFYKGKLEL